MTLKPTIEHLSDLWSEVPVTIRLALPHVPASPTLIAKGSAPVAPRPPDSIPRRRRTALVLWVLLAVLVLLVAVIIGTMASAPSRLDPPRAKEVASERTGAATLAEVNPSPAPPMGREGASLSEKVVADAGPLDVLTMRGIPATESELFERVKDKDAVTVELLLDAGVSPNAMGDIWLGQGLRLRVPALTKASLQNDLEMVQLLLAHRAIEIEKVEEHISGEGWIPGSTPLLFAVEFGKRSEAHDVVAALIGARANVHASDSGRNSVLGMVQRGDIARLLIKNGADVNAANEWGVTPLIAAVGQGLPDVVAALIEAGADVRALDKSGRSALLWVQTVDIPEAERSHIAELLVAKELEVETQEAEE